MPGRDYEDLECTQNNGPCPKIKKEHKIMAQYPQNREYRQYRVHYFEYFGGPGKAWLGSGNMGSEFLPTTTLERNIGSSLGGLARKLPQFGLSAAYLSSSFVQLVVFAPFVTILLCKSPCVGTFHVESNISKCHAHQGIHSRLEP